MARAWLLAIALVTPILLVPGCRPPAGDKSSGKVTLAAVGDVFFCRGVARQIEKHGPNYPFQKTENIIREADLAFCNLECCLSTRGIAQRRRYRFRADPAFAAVLREAGFDVASLANNHTLDFGRDAMLDTIDAVESAGMLAPGAGRNREQALALRTIEKNGVRVGFIAYTDLPTVGVVRLSDRPTVAGVNADQLAQEVKRAKSDCDALVVSFHWGVEYMSRPTERQQMLAHLCIDSGADLILGHHPHVLQTVEVYKDKPIVYSMGAFVWDAKIFDADKSAIYLFDLGKDSARLTKTIAVDITRCRPARSGSSK